MIDFDSLITNIEAFDVLPVCHRLVAVEMTAENLADVSIQAKKTSPTLIEDFNDKAKCLYSSDLSSWMYNLILGLSHINKRSYLYTLYDIKGNVTIINELHNNVNQDDFKIILRDFFTAHYSDIPFDRFLIEKHNLNYEFRETLWNYVLDETKCMDSLEIFVELLPYKTFRSNTLLLSCTAAEQIKSNNKKLWWTFWQRITKYQVLTRHMINRFAYTIITNQEWATNVIRHSPDLWGCDSKIIKLFKEKQIPN